MFASQDVLPVLSLFASTFFNLTEHKVAERENLVMSKAAQALPELFSPSVEAKVYSVAAREYTDAGPPEFYPQYTDSPDSPPPHSYHFTPVRFWTSGFFPGSLWLLYERVKVLEVTSGNVPVEEWKRLAISWTKPLKEQATRTNTHDMGFLFMPTFYKWMTLESDPAVVEDAKSTFLCAAASLTSRFNPTIGCLRSWDQSNHLANGVKREDMDKHFLVIIDNMMNLELLYAADYHSPSEAPALSNIATTHALTTMANHFHPSGGTYHVLNYDQQSSSPEEPAIIKRWAHQGYGDESVWGRGQAWALYGYARSAEWSDILNRRNRLGQETGGLSQEIKDLANLLEVQPQNAPFEGDERLLDQAIKAADFFVGRLGDGPAAVPPWDFDCPDNPDGSLTFRDVSAGMIAASGMLTLHSLLRRRPTSSSTSPYLSHAVKIIRATVKYCSTPEARFTVGEPPAVDLGEGQWDTILNQATINYNENAPWKKADCGLVYADYYFLEVGNKLLEMERRGWISSTDLG